MLCRTNPTAPMHAQKADILAQRNPRPARAAVRARRPALSCRRRRVLTAFGIAPRLQSRRHRHSVREALALACSSPLPPSRSASSPRSGAARRHRRPRCSSASASAIRRRLDFLAAPTGRALDPPARPGPDRCRRRPAPTASCSRCATSQPGARSMFDAHGEASRRAAARVTEAPRVFYSRDDPLLALRRDRLGRHPRCDRDADRARLRHRHRLPHRPATRRPLLRGLRDGLRLGRAGRAPVASSRRSSSTTATPIQRCCSAMTRDRRLLLADGSNRAKAFLRSPVEFSRVSSGFRRPPPSDLQELARAYRRRFRGAERHARDRLGRRQRRRGGPPRRIRQRSDPHTAARTTLYAHLSVRAGHPRGCARAPGRADRVRRVRPATRPARTCTTSSRSSGVPPGSAARRPAQGRAGARAPARAVCSRRVQARAPTRSLAWRPARGRRIA